MRFELLLLAFYVSYISTQGCVDISSMKEHVIGWWKLDREGNEQPNMMNGVNGIIGAGTVVEETHVNGSLRFVDAYMSLVADVLKPHTRDFSIEFWFRRERNGRFEMLVDFKDQRGTGLGIFLDNGDSLIVEVGVNNSSRQLTTKHVVSDTARYHHIAVVVERDAYTKVYVDGDVEELTQHYVPRFDMTPETSEYVIGAEFNGNVYEKFFSGVLDEVTYYFTVVPPETIQAIYDAGTDGKCSLDVDPVVITAPPVQNVTATPTTEPPTNAPLECNGAPPVNAVCNGETGIWEIEEPIALEGGSINVFVPIVYKGDFTVSEGAISTISLFNGASLTFEQCPTINETLTVFIDILNETQRIISLPDGCDIDEGVLNLVARDTCAQVVTMKQFNQVFASIGGSTCTENGSSKMEGKTIAWISSVTILAVLITIGLVVFLAYWSRIVRKKINLKAVEQQLENDLGVDSAM